MTRLLYDPVIHRLIDSGHEDHALYSVAADRCEDLGYPTCAQVLRWLWSEQIQLHRLRERWWQITTWKENYDSTQRHTVVPDWLTDVPRKHHPQSWRRCVLLLLDLAYRQDLGESYESPEVPPYGEPTWPEPARAPTVDAWILEAVLREEAQDEQDED